MSLRHSLVLSFLVVPLLSGCSSKTTFTHEVPKEDIQKKINTKFPQTVGGEKESSPVRLTLSDPVVLLEEGKNQVGVRFNIVAEPSGGKPSGPPGLPEPPPPTEKKRFTGHAVLFGSVSYNPGKKTIHVSDPKVTDLQIAQLPGELIEPLKRLAEQATAKKFAQEPIPLDNTTAHDKAVTTFLKSVTVKDGKLLVEIGW